MEDKNLSDDLVITIKKGSLIFVSIILVGFISGIVVLSFNFFNIGNKNEIINKIVRIKTANASLIYPKFLCGCCGKPLDLENICCGDMQQKIDYIDSQVSKGLSEDQIILKMVKKFGFDSLAEEGLKQSIKSRLEAEAPADSSKIFIDKKYYDFGTISQADGVVFTEFDIKNTGKSELIINKLTTSCGCTSASIVYKGKEGPAFTMPGHGKDNPVGWSISIAPLDSAKLKIYYDPNAHGKQKEDTLFITRTIDIFSNDPIDFENRFKIELKQIP